jgi:hypothetical protein
MQRSHNTIVASAAREALSPLQFQQKGRSRTWLADHGWWLTVVEFQPSSWSKGSYLNVGAHWLWTDSGHLSFDFGYRVAAFERYESDEQFIPAARTLAECAAERARELAQLFRNVNAAAGQLQDTLIGMDPALLGSWGSCWGSSRSGPADGGRRATTRRRDRNSREASGRALGCEGKRSRPIQADR